jgi:hypothetical protein
MASQTKEAVLVDLTEADDDDRFEISYFEHEDGLIEILDDEDLPKNKKEESEQSEGASGIMTRKRLRDSASKKCSSSPSKEHKMSAAVEVVLQRPLFRPAAAVADSAADDEIELLGSNGDNALVDFPHAREDCAVWPFQVNPNRFCPNCFCWVCEVRADDCNQWSKHCSETRDVD